jgi:hypothetical protein
MHQNFKWVKTQLACRFHKSTFSSYGREVRQGVAFLLKGHDVTCGQSSLCL